MLGGAERSWRRRLWRSLRLSGVFLLRLLSAISEAEKRGKEYKSKFCVPFSENVFSEKTSISFSFENVFSDEGYLY